MSHWKEPDFCGREMMSDDSSFPAQVAPTVTPLPIRSGSGLEGVWRGLASPQGQHLRQEGICTGPMPLPDSPTLWPFQGGCLRGQLRGGTVTLLFRGQRSPSKQRPIVGTHALPCSPTSTVAYYLCTFLGFPSDTITAPPSLLACSLSVPCSFTGFDPCSPFSPFF